MMSKKKELSEEDLHSVLRVKNEQDALDAIQTDLQIIANEMVDAASVDLTSEIVAEMKQMAAKFSRAIMQAELKLNQT